MFLARRSYRVRRLRDAVRMMPVLGAFVLLLPLLWEPAAGQDRDLARDAVYVFVVWTGLIILSAFLARRLRLDPKADDPVGPGDEE
jgi:hypothetical protein